MKLTFIDKVGALGVLGSAAACPVCWPLFATAGSAMGLGILAPYEPVIMSVVFPFFVLIALVGGVFGFLNHRKPLPLIVNVAGVSLILYGFYGGWHLDLMYMGIFGVLISSVLAYFANRQCRIAKTRLRLHKPSREATAASMRSATLGRYVSVARRLPRSE